MRLSRLPQSRCTVTTFSADLDGLLRPCRSPITSAVRGNVSGSPWVMPMPPPTSHVVADDCAPLDDGDEAEVVGEHVHVVVRRHRDDDLELARQIVLAVDRLLLGATVSAIDDLLAVEPDLVIGAGPRQQVIADRARQLVGVRVRLRLVRVGRRT